MFLVAITISVLGYTITGNIFFNKFKQCHKDSTRSYKCPSSKFLFLIKYLIRLERHDMFDMVPILHDSTILIVRPTPLDMDLGLLIRPYRKDAWVFVAVVVVAIFGLLLIPFLFISEYSKYTR